jgi:uncharacterized membrane protein
MQTLFLAAGVFPLYGIARLCHGRRMSLIIGAVYLLYPGLGFTNLYEFHPTCFAVFFLMCTAYYFYKEDFNRFNIFMVLSLLCQENIALIFIMWGVYALILKRKLKWALSPSLAGLVYFLFCVYIILPFFNRNTFNFFHIYGPLGSSLGGVLQTCFLHPVRVAGIIFQPLKIGFLFNLFLSVLFIPLFSPLALIPVFLIFLQHLLSFRPSESSLHYHYTAELIPFIFVAFVFGIRKIFPAESKKFLLGLLLLLNALFVNFILGPHFQLLDQYRGMSFHDRVAQKEALVKQVPEDASVVATFEFLPHLSHHQYLYSFHHVYSGYFTLFSKPYQLPEGVEYALIDFNDNLTFTGFYNPANYRHIDDFMKEGAWGALDVEDSIVLFKKGVKAKYPLYELVNDQAPLPHKADLTVDKRIALYGYDIKAGPESIHLDLYWKLLKPEQKDVNIFIDFINQNGKIIDRQPQPLCYRIWPTQAWGTGQLIEDHHYITVLPKFRGRLKSLMVGFFDYKTKMLIPTDARDGLGRIKFNLTGP